MNLNILNKILKDLEVLEIRNQIKHNELKKELNEILNSDLKNKDILLLNLYKSTHLEIFLTL